MSSSISRIEFSIHYLRKNKCCIRVDWRKRSEFSVLSLSRKEMLSRSRELDVQSALREKCGLPDFVKYFNGAGFSIRSSGKMKLGATTRV